MHISPLPLFPGRDQLQLLSIPPWTKAHNLDSRVLLFTSGQSISSTPHGTCRLFTNSLNQFRYSHIPVSLQVCRSWQLVSKNTASRWAKQNEDSQKFYSHNCFFLVLVPSAPVLDLARLRICVLGFLNPCARCSFFLIFFPLTLVTRLVGVLSSPPLVRIA